MQLTEYDQDMINEDFHDINNDWGVSVVIKRKKPLAEQPDYVAWLASWKEKPVILYDYYEVTGFVNWVMDVPGKRAYQRFTQRSMETFADAGTYLKDDIVVEISTIEMERVSLEKVLYEDEVYVDGFDQDFYVKEIHPVPGGLYVRITSKAIHESSRGI